MLKFKKEVNFYYQEVQKPEEVEIEAITLYGSRENRFTQKRRGFHKDDRAKSHITIGKLDDYEEDDSDDEKEQQLKKIIKEKINDDIVDIRIGFSDGDDPALDKDTALDLLTGKKSLIEVYNEYVRNDKKEVIEDVRKQGEKNTILGIIGGVLVGAIGGIVGVNLSKNKQ